MVLCNNSGSGHGQVTGYLYTSPTSHFQTRHFSTMRKSQSYARKSLSRKSHSQSQSQSLVRNNRSCSSITDDIEIEEAINKSPFKISEWPSTEDLQLDENANKSKKKHHCSCYSCLHGNLSVLYGKRRMNRPTDSIIDYFKNQLEYRSRKIKGSSTALITKSRNYTFNDIHEISDQVADILKATLQDSFTSNPEYPEGETAIGIAFPDQVQQIITQIGILKTGCCYLPIDYINLPTKQILEIVNTVRPILIISSEDSKVLSKFDTIISSGICGVMTIGALWNLLEINTDSNSTKQQDAKSNKKDVMPPSKIRNRDSLILRQDSSNKIVAIYYTRGVSASERIKVSNRSLWNRIFWEWEQFPYGRKEVMVYQSDLYEISSIAELFAPLLAGKPILITDTMHIDKFLVDICTNLVTRVNVFPSLLSSFLLTAELYKESSTDILKHVKWWFCYRATLRVDVARKFFNTLSAGAKLVQIHGIAETLNVISYKVFENLESIKSYQFYEVLPAGQPVSNMRIYITDSEMNLLQQGETGEISISGVLLPTEYTDYLHCTTTSLVPNPFFAASDDDIYEFLFKTGDYGRMISQGSIFNPPVLIFEGRAQSTVIINNHRINTKEIYLNLKEIKQIRGCHVMVYRPCTLDQQVLAFVTIRKKGSITVGGIIEKLRETIPEYMMPNVILVEAFPMNSNQEVDQTALMEAYFKDRNCRMNFDNWQILKLNSSEQLKAAKVLFDEMFNITGISKQIIADHMDWPIFKLRVRLSIVPLILIRLRRNGYVFDFDEFMQIKDVRELINRMATKRQTIGDSQRFLRSQAFEIELINQSTMKEVHQLFFRKSSTATGVGSMIYYAGIKNKQLETFFGSFWKLMLEQPLSVLARRVQDEKLVALFFNFNHGKKYFPTYYQGWTSTSTYPMKYRLEFADSFDKFLENKIADGLTDRELFLLQTVFIVIDSQIFENFDETEAVLELLFKNTVELALKHSFRYHCAISFENIITNTAVNIMGYKVESSQQVNQFVAEDKKKPFKLAPDYLVGKLLLKKIDNPS